MFGEYEWYFVEFIFWVLSRKFWYFGFLVEFKFCNLFLFEVKIKIKENDILEVREIELEGNISY